MPRVPEKQLILTESFVNGEAGALPVGAVVAAGPTSGEVLLASGATDSAIARVFGVLTSPAPVAAAAAGEFATKRGTLVTALFEGSLTLTRGDRVYVSPATAGEVTNVRPSTNGQVVIEVGRIISVLTYNGAGDELAQIQLVDGERVVVGAGGGTSPVVLPDADNQTGSLLAEGSLVAASSLGAKRVQLFDASSAIAEGARYVGVVTESGGIANGATGEVTFMGLITVLFKSGLTLLNADEVYSSDTLGEATNLADLFANPVASGGVRLRLGVVLDQATYAGSQTALCMIYPGQRSEQP